MDFNFEINGVRKATWMTLRTSLANCSSTSVTGTRLFDTSGGTKLSDVCGGAQASVVVEGTPEDCSCAGGGGALDKDHTHMFGNSVCKSLWKNWLRVVTHMWQQKHWHNICTRLSKLSRTGTLEGKVSFPGFPVVLGRPLEEDVTSFSSSLSRTPFALLLYNKDPRSRTSILHFMTRTKMVQVEDHPVSYSVQKL